MSKQIHFAVSWASEGLDPSGIHGMLLHYAITILLVGGAFILFAYFWSKGRLDFDESPKIQMLRSDEEPQKERMKDE